MKIGALTFSPCRRASSAWPSSCTNRSRTNPAAKGRPQKSAYAAIETNIVAAVVNSFSLKTARART